MVIKTIKAILYRCWDFSLFITGEGSWSLTPLEKLILNAVKSVLTKDALKLLNAQLSQKYFVQRINDCRINSIFFYDKNENYKIPGDDLLFRVEIEINKRKQDVHVTFFDGYITNIEFKKGKKFYHGEKVKVCDVTIGNSDKSHALAIDRLEHGRK